MVVRPLRRSNCATVTCTAAARSTTKGMLAANVMSMLQLTKRASINGTGAGARRRLRCDVRRRSRRCGGMRWLVENHPASRRRVRDQRGRTHANHRRRKAIPRDSDGREDFSHGDVTARGPAGHAAIPLEGNAVFQLGAALVKLAGYREPVTLNSTTSRFFGELSKVWPAADVAEAMRDVVSSDAETSDGARSFVTNPGFRRSDAKRDLTGRLGGGVAGNVIPAEVTATLNVRTIPGHRIEDVVDRIRQAIGSETVSSRLHPTAKRHRLGSRFGHVPGDSRFGKGDRPGHPGRALPEHGWHRQRPSEAPRHQRLWNSALPDGAVGRGTHARARRTRSGPIPALRYKADFRVSQTVAEA